MFYKILHNIDLPLHCKLPQFAKPIRITRHIAQKNYSAFVVAKYYTYQFSRCFTYFTTHLWNSLPNEAVLAVNQVLFMALAKKKFVD